MIDPQDRGDHVDRDRHAEVGHQVERLAGRQPVQRAVDNRLPLGPDTRHAGIQRLGQRMADARVVGIVEHQDRSRLAARQRAVHTAGEHPRRHRLGVALQRICPQAAVVDRRTHISIAGEENVSAFGVHMHRASAAKVVQDRIRIVAVGFAQRRQVDQRGKRRIIGHRRAPSAFGPMICARCWRERKLAPTGDRSRVYAEPRSGADESYLHSGPACRQLRRDGDGPASG